MQQDKENYLDFDYFEPKAFKLHQNKYFYYINVEVVIIIIINFDQKYFIAITTNKVYLTIIIVK
jgi:hypothetical protein